MKSIRYYPFGDKNDSGKIIMSWSGVILLLILPTGLFLWWKQKRIAIRWKGSSRIKWFDIHSVVGLFSFVFIFILAGTGVMIGFEKQTVPFFYKMTNSKPVKEPDIKVTHLVGAQPISPDSAMQIEKQTLPGALPFEINVPDTDVFMLFVVVILKTEHQEEEAGCMWINIQGRFYLV